MLDGLTHQRGLRAKVVAWVLIPTAIILTAVGGVAFYASQEVTEDLVLERNQDRTELLANQLSSELQAYQTALGVLAAEAVGRPFSRMQLILDTEWPVGSLSAFDAGLLILDADGEAVATVPENANLTGRAFPELLVGDPVYRLEQLPLSDILFDAIAGLDVIALSYPVMENEDVITGTVVGLFHAERGATRTSSFYRRIWELYIGRQETGYLVDSSGHVIFHPDTFLIGEDFSSLESVRTVLRGVTSARRTQDVEGRDVVAGFSPVPRTPWALITEERWSSVTQAIRPFSRFMMILLALGVIVPVALVALGVRRITQPVAQLTRAAQEIAEGDFSRVIDVGTGDELETLARQFNAMAAELRASYAHLEQRVADRTQELLTLNAVSAVVSQSLDLGEVMGAALTKTLETMGMEAGAAFLLAGGESLSLIARQGLSETFVEHVQDMTLHQSIAAEAVWQAAPVVRELDDYPEGALRDALREEGLQSVISVPLMARGEALGVLNLATRTPRTMSSEERSLLASVGQQAGLAVENARLYEEAESAAAAAERSRLARELHDAVSQTLFSASMIADVLPRLWQRNPEEAERRLQDLRRLTRGAMAEMRTLLWELRPAALVETDLNELLGQLCAAVAGRAHVEVILETEPAGSLSDDVKVALYRITQEALNNVVKHAEASRVTVGLRSRDGDIELCIRDNGRGFGPEDVPPGHLGLRSIRERAESIGAKLDLNSRPGEGTVVIVLWKERKADERNRADSSDAC